MSRIPDELIQHVREESNIVDVVSEYVQLKKSGQNHFAHCPFHEDNTPSFSVNEDKQIFHCFSCGRGGSVFNFLMEMDGLSYPEAIFKVADINGIAINQELKASVLDHQVPTDPKRAFLYQVHEKATEFYHHMLMNSKMGQDAYQYLLDRGMTKETLTDFQIGFAPKKRDMLYQYLLGIDDMEVTNEKLLESGIFSQPKSDDQESLLDRFFNRIIFPIKDHQGRVVAFSGRVLKDDSNSDFKMAKYLNSPETYIFNKRKVLFNYDKAKATIRREKEVFLFEGFMDVISAWQAGLTNGVASMGTSFTEDHVQFLNQKTDKIIISYDGDDAGIEAAKRLTELIQKTSKLPLKVLVYPSKMDPDDYINNYGSKSFLEFVDNGRKTYVSFLMFYFQRNRNLNNEAEKIDYLNQIVPQIARIQSAPERELYIQELSKEVDLSFESLLEQVQIEITKNNQTQSKQLKQGNNKLVERPIVYRHNKEKLSRVERAERNLLNRLFNFEDTIDIIYNLNADFFFTHDNYQQLFILFEAYLSKNKTDFSFNQFIDYIKNEDQRELIHKIQLIDLHENPTDEEIADYIRLICYQSPLLDQLQEKKVLLEQAKRDGNSKKQLTLTIEITNLLKRIKD